MGVNRDWRNPKDYEFTKSLNSDGWAWEFLRRNPDYIKDWVKAQEKDKIDRQKYKAEFLPKIITILETGKGTIDFIPGFGKKLNAENMSAKERKVLIIYALGLLKEEIPSEVSSDGASEKWGFYLDELIQGSGSLSQNPFFDSPS